MQYELIKSNRKTIAISFDRDGNLIVKAPIWVSDRKIAEFVSKKQEWIDATAKRLENARKEKETSRIKLENGDKIPYLGGELMLSVVREERSRGRLKCLNDRILMWVPYIADYEYKRELLEKWYRRQAAEILHKKAYEFASLLQVGFEGVYIKDQKSRWGSCSGRGNLNFNFRILMAPEEVCDYVVMHELCHLVHMNHSKEFWELLATVCPRYKTCKKWLIENGETLYFI